MLKTAKQGSFAKTGLYYLACAALFALPLGTSPFTILGFCILGLWVFSGEFLRGTRIYLHEQWFLPLCAFAILPWVGLIWSQDLQLGLGYASKSHHWLLALAIASAAPVIRQKEGLVPAFLAGLFINAVAAFLQLGSILPRFSSWGAKGYTGFNGGYNTLGILLVLGILLASFYFKTAQGRKRALAGFLIIVYFVHLMLIEGRGAYLTFFILSPLLFYNVLGSRRRLWIIIAWMIASGILYSSPIVRDRVNRVGLDLQHQFHADRMENFGKNYSNGLDRAFMWRWALTIFAEHPLLGVGTGGYRQAILSHGGGVAIVHPHNNILHMAASFGVCGLFVFGWFFWVLLKRGWVYRNHPLGFFVMASGLVILMGGITDTHIVDVGGAFLLALTTGIQASLQPRGSEEDASVSNKAPGHDRVGSHPDSPLRTRILYRYVFYEIWPILLVSLLIAIFIALAARMLNISEWVINHGVPLGEVGKMILYLLPGMVLFSLPAAVLMAVFIAFLRLSNDNEIMALKSSGVSLFQMLPPVITMSLIAFLAAMSISIYVVPWGNRSFKDLVFRIARSKADMGIKERIFSEPFKKVTFYVSSFSQKEKIMKDLFLVDRREPSLTTTIVAKEGVIVSDPKGRAIVIHLSDGTAFTTEKKSQAARTIQFSTYDVTIDLDDIMPSDLSRKRSPKEMVIAELIRQIRTEGAKQVFYNRMAAELMERFSIPFAVFLMGIIGAPLGAQIRSGGRSLAVFTSMAVFISYYLFLTGMRSLGEAGVLSPFVGMWLPAVFLLALSWFFLRRVQNERSLLGWERLNR